MTLLVAPRLNLLVDDAPLGAANLLTVRVVQQLSLPTQCELTLAPLPTGPDPGDTLALGARLAVTVGTQGDALFDGRITALEYRYGPDAGRLVHVRAYDALHDLRRRRTIRAHVQVTARDVAAELAAAVGLSVSADAAGPLYPYLIQHGQSDFDFLLALLERAGLFATVRAQTLALLTLAGTDDEVALTLGDTLLEARLSVNNAVATPSVTAHGWNPLLMEPFSGTVHQARSGRQVGAVVDSAEPVTLVDEDLADFATVDAVAQAELDARHAADVVLWGVARGSAALRPGARVTVDGVAAAVAGRYVLTAATHTYDSARGYLTELSSAPPALPPRPRGALATLGVVTQVDDPDQMGRIRCALPGYDNVETDWMQVVAPAAGVNKGLAALPDVDDNVLVLCMRHNPAQGVVLGGIFGPFAPYDSGVDGGRVQRYSWRTPNGHLVVLDDTAKTLRVADSHGSFVEMTPDLVRFFANTDLEMSAPGRAITIQADTIDFRRV